MPLVCFDEGLLPAPDDERIAGVEAWFARYFDRALVLPDGWKRHVRRWHGGAPRDRCLRAPDGRIRAVCRMLNLYDDAWCPPVGVDSWRVRGRDVSRDFSIDLVVNAPPFEGRLLDTPRQLVPIAALDHAGHDPRGMAEFDLLCFDVTDPGAGLPLVTWSFESSWNGRDLVTVAASWDELEASVRGDLPDPCAEPPTPAWS